MAHCRKDEEQLQKRCVRILRDRHPEAISYRHDGGDHLVMHAQRTHRTALGGHYPGAPDLLIILRGADGSSVLAVEFKSEKGTVKPHQEEVHSRMRVAGVHVHIVRDEADFFNKLMDHTHGEAWRDDECVFLFERTPAQATAEKAWTPSSTRKRARPP